MQAPHPHIIDLLSDPLVDLVMRADGVDCEELASMLARVASGLTALPENAAAPVSASCRVPLERLRLDPLIVSCIAASTVACDGSTGKAGAWI